MPLPENKQSPRTQQSLLLTSYVLWWVIVLNRPAMMSRKKVRQYIFLKRAAKEQRASSRSNICARSVLLPGRQQITKIKLFRTRK